MSHIITESEVEQVALDILSEMGYKTIYGPDIAPDGEKPERQSYSEVVLVDRLKTAIDKLNPKIPQEAREEAVKKVLRNESPNTIVNNQHFHKMVVNGIDIEYRKDGRIVGDKVWLFDFNNPKNNEFLAVNQFTVIENNNNRRPDIVLFVNGLPLAVIELKNPADENATVKAAFNQLETYKTQIPSLFNYNEILVVSDGIDARAGTITSEWERFLPWKTIEGIEKAPKAMPHKNLALELLKRLLNDEIKTRSKKNLIQGRSFAEMLERTIRKYQNKAIEAAQIIEELIELAKDMREAGKRGEKLNLTDDELAFYDALEVNDSAVKVLGDETLRTIARELVKTVRNNVTIDWTLKESVQAKLRVMVKRILRKYGYPPDKQKKATETVLEQATLICKDWAD